MGRSGEGIRDSKFVCVAEATGDDRQWLCWKIRRSKKVFTQRWKRVGLPCDKANSQSRSRMLGKKF